MPVTDKAATVWPRFQDAAGRLLQDTSQTSIGLAVSGGGDSMAMLHLAARQLGPERIRVITIDHGFREAAADEVAHVSAQAAALGIQHIAAKWHWDGTGNLQAAARAGRWAAIRDWATASGVSKIWLGHTEDDQVETLLMRLARGSGIDGLAAMAQSTRRDGIAIQRPLLGLSRDDLRDWLKAEQIAWCDDPSNDDPRFDRVRARQMYPQLQTLGLTRKRLLQTVAHMQAGQASLQHAAQLFAKAHVRQDAGDLIFDEAALDLGGGDTARRVMAAAFGWVGNRGYRPRFEQLCDAVGRAAQGVTSTLGGCILSRGADGMVRMTREAAATQPLSRSGCAELDVTGVIWDGRWFLEGPLQDGQIFRALGDAIKDCPQWRNSGMPRKSLLASPSVWLDGALIAAPMAGLSNGWAARMVTDFHSSAFAIED
ncbi:tRNA lysidine(34) synthetase TilS [Loktanella sp. Alg231-35]|uniref:tRNA lysidine(34) synthetase TilS n=1 Tax=Loktanella sp. Alg231-35 TaxID=1922220 RepID=UPI000D55A438|nr:tRNA lysidine(34) synthetase TilS [Loktanella sp. Alg231-35]